MEYKRAPHFIKEIAGDLVTGIFAVHGNVDSGDDRSHPGAFTDTTIAGRARVKFLWQHDSNSPPIATIKAVHELSRAELPEKVLHYAPDATGGVAVTREYYEKSELARHVMEGIQRGDIDEMSYAYDVGEHKITTNEDGTSVRELYKVRLWDISDVNWGMNPATAGVKGLHWKAQPLMMHADAVEAALREWQERVHELKERRTKEGRTFSATNSARIGTIAEALLQAGDDLKQMLLDSTPQKDTTPDEVARRADLRRLVIETQRTLARINGVRIP